MNRHRTRHIPPLLASALVITLVAVGGWVGAASASAAGLDLVGDIVGDVVGDVVDDVVDFAPFDFLWTLIQGMIQQLLSALTIFASWFAGLA